jgi:hypothetical protein
MGHFDLIRSVSFDGDMTDVVIVPPAAKTMAVQFPALAAGTLSVDASIDGESYAPLNGKNGSDDVAYSWVGTTGEFVVSVIPVLGLHSVQFVNTVDQSAADPVTVRFVQDKMAV